MPTVKGTAKKSVIAHAITTQSAGASLARSKTAANIAPATANEKATREHRQVRPGGKRGARTRHGLTDPCVADEGNPYWPQRAFRQAVHTDQL